MVINLNYGENAMQYGMYQEIMDQPISLRRTIESERRHLEDISEQFSKLGKPGYESLKCIYKHFHYQYFQLRTVYCRYGLHLVYSNIQVHS